MSGDTPTADIIALDSISRFVQLVPRFGKKALGEVRLDTYTSMDVCKYFYINSFADKEIYQAVY
jgi:hypothetical protein